MNRYRYMDGSEMPERSVNHFYAGSKWKMRPGAPATIKRAGRPLGLPPTLTLIEPSQMGWWIINEQGTEFSRQLIRAYYEPI